LHALAQSTTCANLQQNWFIRLQNIAFRGLIAEERTDGQGQLENIVSRVGQS